MDLVTLTIDGQRISVAKSSTILEAAKVAGISIPTLCYLADLSPEGACRVCVVEVEGARTLVTACTYRVSANIKIHTNIAAIRDARREVVKLLLANHPQECLSCQRNLNCEMQKVAADLVVREVEYSGEKRPYSLDDFNPFIVRDNNKCILCGRCIRVCKEIQCCDVLEWSGREALLQRLPQPLMCLCTNLTA
jgi:NADH dehydrogenase/NADH:ubiquinone oxidoreductase subunit G